MPLRVHQQNGLHLENRRSGSKLPLGMVLLSGQAVWAAGALPVPSAAVYLGIWANPALAQNPEAAIEIREGPAPGGINRPFAFLPASLADGDQPIKATYNGFSTQPET